MNEMDRGKRMQAWDTNASLRHFSCSLQDDIASNTERRLKIKKTEADSGFGDENRSF